MTPTIIALMSPPSDSIPLKDALRQVPAFSDLEDSQLEWFARNSEDLWLEAGEVFIRKCDSVDYLVVLLEGEIHVRRESAGADSPTIPVHAGQVTGLLPFSRMKNADVSGRTTARTRFVRLHRDRFDEMMTQIPQLTPRLVGFMADRIRQVSIADQQHEKLISLGKLSAGLAHELNNPASAARRAAETLRRCVSEFRKANARIDTQDLTREQRQKIVDIEAKIAKNLLTRPVLDSLEQSDMEDQIANWMQRNGVDRSAIPPSRLVETGFTEENLNSLRDKFENKALTDVLDRITIAANIENLTSEIESTTGRMSDLVRAIKEYSYMDQNPEQEIDIHQSIETTLMILKFRLRGCVKVIKRYDANVPRIFAHGGELNQVWTNLIDNAVDAMSGQGVLRIETSLDGNTVVIEITDNGPGIPEEVQPQIFEAFFTTKERGIGTGLGLEIVQQIVRKHHGDITFQSRPGETKFRITLPSLRGKETV